jgi:hypothetical protein
MLLGFKRNIMIMMDLFNVIRVNCNIMIMVDYLMLLGFKCNIMIMVDLFNVIRV